MPAPSLLAIDLGQITGWSIGSFIEVRPTTGVWPLPVARGPRLVALENTLIRWMDRWTREGHDIRFVMHAAPFIGRNMHEVRQGIGALGILEAECERRGIRCMEQHESTVRKDVLGRGQGKSEAMKALVMRWCDIEGISVADHNAGDSAVLWRWARDELVRQRRFA